jgi:hypothetical protein
VVVTANDSKSPHFLALEISVKLWMMNIIVNFAISIPKHKFKGNAKREVKT